jgi:hypothetical protein
MIKRFFATKDNSITNAFESNVTTRATGSNSGQADVLEVFSIFGQTSSSASGFSKELSRILITFDIEAIKGEKDSGVIPATAKYYLKMYNAPHSQTVPRNYNLEVAKIGQDWQEGDGLDLENYSDLTYNVRGSNWIKCSGSTDWSLQGGSVAGGTSVITSFPIGNEDLEVDVTTIMSEWFDNMNLAHGFMVRLPLITEAESASFYTKKFFARSTNNHFDKPVLEVRWDDSRRDDRGLSFISSSALSSEDNLNTIYMYNYFKGRLKNIPNLTDNVIHVNLHTDIPGNQYYLGGNAIPLPADGVHVKSTSPTTITGGLVSTGVYTASFAFASDRSSGDFTLRDVWWKPDVNASSASHAGIDVTQYYTGSLEITHHDGAGHSVINNYVLSVSNRLKEYYCGQTYRFRLYARDKKWSPSIYTTATSVPNSLVFESASYQIYRVVDDRVIVPYETGSILSTRLSYDVSGNYFDLDTSYLEPNYTYGLNISVYNDYTQNYEQQSLDYKFRVVKNEY